MTISFLRTPAFTVISIALSCGYVLSCQRALGADAGPNRSPSHHYQNQPTQGSGSTIYGRAIYDDNELPVKRAGMVLRSVNRYGRPEQLSTTINARGEFRFVGVPAGRYFIGVNLSGIISLDNFIDLDEQSGSRFDFDEIGNYFQEVVVDGKTDKQVLVRARRGAIISGKVTYTSGDLAVNHPITILRRKGDRYSMFWINAETMSMMMRTDDRGTFRMWGVPPGEYIVGATPMIEHGDLVKDETWEANMVGSALAMTFYPSATRVTQATPVRVKSGEERRGVDIILADAETRTLAGIVRDRLDHRPIPGVRVGISRSETFEKVGQVLWPNANGMPTVTTDEQGQWRLKQVPDGHYLIFVNVAPGDELLAEDVAGRTSQRRKRYAPKRQEVNVAADITDLLIELGEGARVSGKVVVEEGVPLPDLYIGLMREDGNSGSVASGTVHRGKFVIGGVPPSEVYFFVNGNTDQLYVKSITWNGKDLKRELLEIGEDSKIDGVEIILSSRVAQANLRVLTKDSAPVRNTPVVLVPSDAARWGREETQLFCETNQVGTCTITGAPGEYLVFTLPVGVPMGALARDEIKARAGTAPRVTLRAGERGSLDVVMTSNN